MGTTCSGWQDSQALPAANACWLSKWLQTSQVGATDGDGGKGAAVGVTNDKNSINLNRRGLRGFSTTRIIYVCNFETSLL